MKTKNDSGINDRLLTLLQQGVSISPKPFSGIAEQLELDEAEVIQRAVYLKREGLIRRFGGVWNSARLGFKSCLFAVDIPLAKVDNVAAIINEDPGVTHSYLRDGRPNLWFTLTAHESEFGFKVEAIRNFARPYQLLEMPAVKHFKVQVIFDKSGRTDRQRSCPFPTSSVKLTSFERELVKYFQGDVSLAGNCFKAAACKFCCSEENILSGLKKLYDKGALKRIAAIIRHTRFGFKGNSMCVWSMEPDKLAESGNMLASRNEVSHCCERKSCAEFPFNLYAMVHASNEAAVKDKVAVLSSILSTPATMLTSVRELKKTSPVYF
ncbi:hypothetical protein P0136_09420 [Lentisphaerota bacterium ZTH]|nr:hypothetical protein JYG24_13065 [Lentisphaerota bacterium]WET05583.1 hypothetical protein P0136_09420 [Lentisphaerota bacterium ZTH]